MQSLLTDLHVQLVQPPILWCDNIGATYLTSNPLFHTRTKHIEIDFHFVCDQVLHGQLHVQFVSSKDQYVDALIKSLSSTGFLLLRDSLTVRSLPFRLQGCGKEQVHEEEQVNQNSSIPATDS